MAFIIKIKIKLAETLLAKKYCLFRILLLIVFNKRSWQRTVRTFQELQKFSRNTSRNLLRKLPAATEALTKSFTKSVTKAFATVFTKASYTSCNESTSLLTH